MHLAEQIDQEPRRPVGRGPGRGIKDAIWGTNSAQIQVERDITAGAGLDGEIVEGVRLAGTSPTVEDLMVDRVEDFGPPESTNVSRNSDGSRRSARAGILPMVRFSGECAVAKRVPLFEVEPG